MTPPGDPAARWPLGRARAWWSLGLLGALYVLSFIDRVVLALLVEPLKAELHVSDLQLGLLFGPAFAVFYAVLGLPVARYADRRNRHRLIVGGVILWALATIGSAFATGYVWLVALRVGLAIGEAVLTPSAYSLIGDLFPADRRRFAASLYSALGMAGASGAYLVGAMVIQLVPTHGAWSLSLWRVVYLLVGAPSLALGLVFAFTVREPVRMSAAVGQPPGLLKHILQRRALYLPLFAGAGLSQAIGYAYAAWGPEYVRRHFGWPIHDAGYAFGLAGLAAGFTGTIAAPMLTRFAERRGAVDGTIWICLAGLLAGGALAGLAPLVAEPALFLLLYAIALFCLTGAANNVLVSLQVLAPSRLRATLVALQLMSITLLGLGLGPTLVVLVARWLPGRGGGLGLGLALVAVAAAVPAAILILLARKPFRAALAVGGDSPAMKSPTPHVLQEGCPCPKPRFRRAP